MVEIKGDPHEAQWKKYSLICNHNFEKTGEPMFKARYEACERLLLRYC